MRSSICSSWPSIGTRGASGKYLQLTPLEKMLTKIHKADRATTAGIGLLSVTVALLLPSGHSGNAGYVYLLTAPSNLFFGYYSRHKARAFRRH